MVRAVRSKNPPSINVIPVRHSATNRRTDASSGAKALDGSADVVWRKYFYRHWLSLTTLLKASAARSLRLIFAGRFVRGSRSRIPALPAFGRGHATCRGAGMTGAFLGALSIFICTLIFLPSNGVAKTASTPELEGILQKIASRHYRWIALRAEVLLFFAKEGDPNAMCGGDLLYQRLDERMLLTCVDARQELMFVFRTLDRRFDLYLPSQNTVYHGSIFDLEDSPDLSSHLKARDLYRALKPMAVDPRRAKIERNNSLVTSLDVYGRGTHEKKLVRKLYLTPEGDVRGELFYNAKEQPVTEIQRYDFREFRSPVGAYDSIIFPKKITIMSPETKKGSAVFFTRVTALDTIDPLEFILRIPPGTQEVFLEEKDPRFQPSNTSESEAQHLLQRSEVRLTPKAARFQDSKASAQRTAAPVPPIKKAPVYLAAPREKPAAKKTPQAPEPVAAPVVPASLPKDASTNTDADIVVEDQSPEGPSSATDAQTTLDPSVDPAV